MSTRAAARSTLQHRLLVTTVAISIGAVAITGVVTAAAARRATRDAVVTELRREAAGFAQVTSATQQRCAPRRLVQFARNDQAGFAVIRNGAVVRAEGTVRADVLDVAALAAGRTQTVTRPRFVLVAQPLGACPAGTPVFVLERATGFGVGPVGRGLLVAAVIAVVVAAGVAFAFSRRLARPIEALQRAAQTLAGGDLTARVTVTDDAPEELAALATTLNDLAVRLDEARGLERAFLMSISHDLRTPLTSIRGYAEAIADGAVDDDATRRRAAAVIAQEGRRLERLVADLLDLARLDAREFSLRLEPCDIVPVVRAAVEAFAPAAHDAGVSLSYNGAAQAVALVDADRLGQVVGNLVENALQYAASAIRVDVRAVAGPRVEVAVADDGPGIGPADLPHVFERLYTTRHGATRTVGTGLGLAIVRELTAAMGGAVRADTAPDGGTCMTVALRGPEP